MDTGIQPAVKARFDILDALRGFALFGICFANVPVFAGWADLSPDAKAGIAGSQLYDAFMLLLVDGRFYTLFSFLFGIGFALQLGKSNSAQSTSKSSLYLRRLLILLLIGLAHNFLFWFGDILTLYAVLGFALFFLRDSSDKRLLIIALGLFLLPLAGYLVFWALRIDPDLGLYEVSGLLLANDPSVGTLFAGLAEDVNTPSLLRYFELNLELGLARFGYYFDTWRIPKVLAVMLVGMWAGRKLMAGQLLEATVLLRRTAVIGIAVGLPASLVYAYLSGLNSFQPHSLEGFVSTVAYLFAVFPLGFAYTSLFVMLWHKKSSLLRFLAAPGRMALTNYLMQTAICIVIFYGIGFGLSTQYAPLSFALVTILVFAFQVAYSNLWFRFFQFGPLEWAWRALTYGKWFRIRKQAITPEPTIRPAI